MSNSKKQVRSNFRNAVFARDKNTCRKCLDPAIDAHHITDRHNLPNGGYVMENGISLCASCHERAEKFHSTGIAEPTFHPDDLYKIIKSSAAIAYAKSLLL